MAKYKVIESTNIGFFGCLLQQFQSPTNNVNDGAVVLQSGRVHFSNACCEFSITTVFENDVHAPDPPPVITTTKSFTSYREPAGSTAFDLESTMMLRAGKCFQKTSRYICWPFFFDYAWLRPRCCGISGMSRPNDSNPKVTHGFTL